MTNHKDEATRAIDHVLGMLTGPLEPLQRRIAAATLEHAKEHVAAIEEIKRSRRKAKTEEGAPRG